MLIETAAGLLHAEQIARASPRVASLIFGIADFAGELGARDFKQDAERLFLFPRTQLLLAARARRAQGKVVSWFAEIGGSVDARALAVRVFTHAVADVRKA